MDFKFAKKTKNFQPLKRENISEAHFICFILKLGMISLTHIYTDPILGMIYSNTLGVISLIHSCPDPTLGIVSLLQRYTDPHLV